MALSILENVWMFVDFVDICKFIILDHVHILVWSTKQDNLEKQQ